MTKSNDTIELEGTIVDVLPNQMFKVELENAIIMSIVVTKIANLPKIVSIIPFYFVRSKIN